MSHGLFHHKADYEGFMVPASEGGRGPENAREVLGIDWEHHTREMKAYPIDPGKTAAETVYRIEREVWHPFDPSHGEYNVTDDNHTWKVEEAAKPWWFSRLVVVKNEESPYFKRIPGLGAPLLGDGPGVTWFDQSFRVATVGMLMAEHVDQLRYERELLAEADAQKDTIRGRKHAAQCRSFANSARWRATSAITRRWPQMQSLLEAA
jgi:hypothetical protein